MRALGFLLALTGLHAAGCATSSRDVRVPGGHESVYVAVFVDETEHGEVGLQLTEAIQYEIWRRDPAALASFFERDTVAIDGTVVSLKEVPVGEGEIELRVRVRAAIIDKEGRQVADIELAESRARYRQYRSAKKTEAARRQALEDAVRDMAHHVVRQIDQAGAQTAFVLR